MGRDGAGGEHKMIWEVGSQYKMSMLHWGVVLNMWRVEEDNMGWFGSPECTRPLATEVMRERCPSAIGVVLLMKRDTNHWQKAITRVLGYHIHHKHVVKMVITWVLGYHIYQQLWSKCLSMSSKFSSGIDESPGRFRVRRTIAALGLWPEDPFFFSPSLFSSSSHLPSSVSHHLASLFLHISHIVFLLVFNLGSQLYSCSFVVFLLFSSNHREATGFNLCKIKHEIEGPHANYVYMSRHLQCLSVSYMHPGWVDTLYQFVRPFPKFIVIGRGWVPRIR